MKKSIFVLTVLGLFTVASSAMAQISACGGTILYNSDCDNSRRKWRISCCPEGYRAQGVAYTDVRKQDHADAVSVVCRSVSRGNDVVPVDFNHSPKQLVCEKTEVLAGIYCKDVQNKGGKNMDTLDGCTAVCEHPGSRDLRRIYQHDIQGGREGKEYSVRLPKRVVGIATKELDDKGGDPGKSDRADCAALIVK